MNPQTMEELRTFLYDEGIVNADDTIIIRNLVEILMVKDIRRLCDHCAGLDMCKHLAKTHGYEPIFKLNKNGWIQLQYAPCGRKGIRASRS